MPDTVITLAMLEAKRACKDRATAWAEYNKVCATALAKYSKDRATAWAEYLKVCDAAFVNAWFDQQENL